MLALEQSPIPLPTPGQAQKVEQTTSVLLVGRTIVTAAILLFSRIRGHRPKGRKCVKWSRR